MISYVRNLKSTVPGLLLAGLPWPCHISYVRNKRGGWGLGQDSESAGKVSYTLLCFMQPPLLFIINMPRAATLLSKEEKEALKLFLQEMKVSEAEFLRRVIRQVLGDRIGASKDITPLDIKDAGNKFTLRMAGSEILAIENRAKKEGFTYRTSWAVSVLRQALSSAPIFTKEEIKVIRESNRELAAIGRNLNQVAHAINIDQRHEDQLTPDLFISLRDHLAEHRERVSRLLDISLNRWGVSNE